jgi:hypothetical protein
MMKKNVLIIFAFIFVLSGCKEEGRSPPVKLNSVTTQSILESIPEKDREVLASFFRFLFNDDPLAYTLHGKKPMSMAIYWPSIRNLYQPGSSLILEKGLELWRKYALKFPSDEFVLKFFKDHRGTSNILLISKTNMLNVVLKNLEIFQCCLGKQMDPKHLVNQICYGEEDFMETLKDNSTLLGILLGYGNVNSKYFERKAVICEEINAKMTPPFYPIQDLESLKQESKILVDCYRGKSFSNVQQRLPPSKGYSNLGDELNEILLHQETFEIYGSDHWLDSQLSPVFAMDGEDPETKALHEEYLVTKKKISKAYSKGEFLEVTLNQWMNPS